MKKKSLYIKLMGLSVFICSIIALAIFMFRTQYYFHDAVSGVTTLVNNEEVFVFVEISHYGFIDSRFHIEMFALLSSFSEPFDTLRKDTIIFHYKRGQAPEVFSMHSSNGRSSILMN